MQDPIAQGFRLSPQQRRLWLLDGGEPASPYRCRCAVRIVGDLDRDTLADVLAAEVAACEILRTSFPVPPGMSLPLQVIGAPQPPVVTELDLTGSEPAERDAAVAALFAAAADIPFALAQNDSLRVTLAHLGPREHVLVLTLPALCADEISLTHLVSRLAAAWRGEEAEPPMQLADVAEWQNQLLESEDTAEGVNRWRETWRMGRFSDRLRERLPFEEDSSAPFAPALLLLCLDSEMQTALEGLLANWRADPVDLFLAAWQAVIAAATGHDDALVGVLCDGRNYEELATAIGPLARHLPIHTALRADRPFRDAVREAHAAVASAAARQEHFGWEQAAGWSGGRDVPGFFPVAFEAASAPQEGTAGVLDAEILLVDAVVERATVALVAGRDSRRRPRGRLTAALRYDASRVSRTAAERLAGRLTALLHAAAARPDAMLGELEALGPAERRQVIEVWSRGAAVPAVRTESTLHHLFAEQAARTPGRPAVVWREASLTYRELDERANRLAHHLIALGVRPETPVALCLDRSLTAIVAVLGVLKAGGTYVPLDPTHPPERLVFILGDTGAPLLLTDPQLAATLPADLKGVRRIVLEDEEDALGAQPATAPETAAGPDNLAYVIYTSGSTGRPKGVLIAHRSPLNLLAALETAVYATAAGRPAPLRASQNAPLLFDASVQQLVLLLAGQTLCIVPEELRTDGPALLAFLREQRLDVFDCTPSQLRLLVAAGLLTAEGAPSLILAAGEAVDQALWEALAGAGRTAVFNIYGPTECTVDATFHRIARTSGNPTIGRPLAGYEVYLLAPDLRPVPIGAPGEICIAGLGLARGYLRRPDATAERFVPHPWNGRPGERLYRTGDLARWREDGEIEFLGRADHQVKIRGYRIEPGEIESVLSRHPWVGEAAVIARPGAGGSPVLIAYAVPGPAAPRDLSGAHAELQGFLRERLPAYMVPGTFVLLPTFPRTASGKVDRRALPAPDLHRPGLGTEYAPPATPVEQLLAAIWEELLGIDRVGIHDSFFDLGGHSLLATQVISRVREALHLELPVRRLFDGPTVAELAGAVEAARAFGPASTMPPLRPVPRDRKLPLSFGQQRLWFLHQLDPTSAAYNTPFALQMRGRPDIAALAWTFKQVVRRHEALRTSFTLSGGQPVQSIAPPGPLSLPVIDLGMLPGPVCRAEAERLTAAEAATPFDLSRPPVVRLHLLRLRAIDHVLLCTLHHISGDAWSAEVLTREVIELYAARAQGREPQLPELPVQYADFAVWQREWLQGAVLTAQLDYWRQQLAGAPPLLELPTDRQRPPVQGNRSGRVSLDLPAGLAGAVEAVGRAEGATPFMTLLAAFAVLLQRYSGQETIVVGTPIANRTRREIEGLIGFFANTLALRTDLGDDPSFRALLRRVRETALGAYAHQDLPFEKLVDELQPPRDMSHAPVFQVMFVHQNAPAPAVASAVSAPAALAFAPFGAGTAAARYDLTLTCGGQAGGLSCGIDYNADLFDHDTAAHMLLGFAHLLSELTARPERPISEAGLVDAEERRAVLTGAVRHAFPEAPEGTLLHDLFRRHAAGAPQAPALLTEGETVTYGELARRVASLAGHLRALGVGPEVRVGLACERSPQALAGILGVLAAGGAWVPLDPEAPRERLAAIAADAGLAVLLTQESFAAGLAGLAPIVLCLDAEPAEEIPENAAPAEATFPELVPLEPDNAAYVIYTSGSTGAPKGVVATHRNAVNFVCGLARAIGAGPADRFFLFAPLSFDASILQIFVPLASGGALAVHRHPRQLAAHEIVALCGRFGVTVLDLPAALWRQWVEEVATRRLPLPESLRFFLTGGESVSEGKLREWAGLTERRAGFLSSYGPTEATVTATVFVTGNHPASASGRPNVPIGRPLPNVRAHVLDAGGQLLPRGVPGDLWLGGDGLSRGYLGRPDLTADAFRPDPLGEPGGRLYRTGDLARWLSGSPEPDLEFLGRADHQVKIRGFRIEIGEIESALTAAHPAIRQGVVAVREDTPGDRRLAAYLVAEAPLPEPAGLRVLLAHRLPDYMIPSSFTFLEQLPVLVTGKVDRAALPAPAPDAEALARSLVPPRNAVEEVLAGLWAEVLRTGRVGIEDDFFALGGHSLLAAQLAGRVRDVLETEVELRLLFEAPTVAGFAALLLRDPGERPRIERIAEITLEVALLADEEVESMLGEEVG